MIFLFDVYISIFYYTDVKESQSPYLPGKATVRVRLGGGLGDRHQNPFKASVLRGFCCIIRPMSAKEFRPELSSRRSETTAWVLALVVAFAIAILKWKVGEAPTIAWVFGAFLIFAAFSISLGNWMDRGTVMSLDDKGIAFENRLRQVALSWPEVKKVNIVPVRWGRSVQVIGEQAHFEFRTLGQVQYQGEIQGKLGFVEGEAVLEDILKKTKLVLEKEEKGRYYYARA